MKFKIGDKVRRIAVGENDFGCCTTFYPKGHVGEVVGFGYGENVIRVSHNNTNWLNTKGKYWELVK